nr:transposase [Myxococcus xanthus]
MTVGMGRTERWHALGGYVTGLILAGERKSIEPMAARLAHAPDQTEALRQRLQQCVSGAAWDDAEVLCGLLQQLLLLRTGHCLLCLRPVNARASWLALTHVTE